MDNHVFEVGLPIAIESYYKSYLTTELLGWKQDVFLITGVVKSSGAAAQLKPNTHCKMRFLKDGIAYGFETKILLINAHYFPVMFCKYPDKIDQCSIRQFKRVAVNLPAQFLDKDGNFISQATLTDISAGGCGFRIPAGEAREPASDVLYRVIFNAMDSDMHLFCAIRKIKTSKDICELGVEFIDATPAEKAKIQSFVDLCANMASSRMDMMLGKMKQTEKILGGRLDEISLIDMMQIFEQLDKEGTIHVKAGAQEGFIAIKNGRVLDASLGSLQGEDALVDLVSLREGEFHVAANKIVSGHMNHPVNFVLMDTCRLADERDALKPYFPGREDRIDVKKVPQTEDPEMQTVVNAISGGAATLARISETTGLSLVRAGVILARALKDGYLMKKA